MMLSVLSALAVSRPIKRHSNIKSTQIALGNVVTRFLCPSLPHTPSFSLSLLSSLLPFLSLLEGDLTFYCPTYFSLLSLPSPRVGLRGGSASSRRPGTPTYGPIHVLHLHLHWIRVNQFIIVNIPEVWSKVNWSKSLCSGLGSSVCSPASSLLLPILDNP